MKKNKNRVVTSNKQPGNDLKKNMPVKTNSTDNIKNTASQMPGLNQEKTTRNDLFPSDGDNLTNV